MEASKVDAFINRMINESRKKAKFEQNKQQAIKLKTHKIPLSKKLEQNTFENFKPITGKKIALDTFMAYAQEFDNKKDGLLLMGETGRGKTHLISALYNKMHEQGRLVIFGNIIKIVTYLKELSGDRYTTEYEAMQKLKNIELILIDDLGQEPNYYNQLIYHLVDYLNENEIKLVTATRKTIPELFEKLGEDTITRILEMCKVVEISGDNYRLISYYSQQGR